MLGLSAFRNPLVVRVHVAEAVSAGIELRTVAWRVNLADFSYEKRLS